jgi:hypothetical protein
MLMIGYDVKKIRAHVGYLAVACSHDAKIRAFL